MPRSRKKKGSKGLSLDLTVVAMFILSIILGLLIYTKSGNGWIGENLTPFLGGILGVIKNVLPIAVFTIAIYLISNKGYLSAKAIQYSIFLISIAVIFCIYTNNNIDVNFKDYINKGYENGANNIGGGAVGAVFAYPFIKLLGSTGSIVLCVGIAIISAIYIFEIKVANLLLQLFAGLKDRRTESKEAKKEEKIQRKLEMEELLEKQASKPKQLKMNLDSEKEKKKIGFFKSLNFDDNEDEGSAEEPVRKPLITRKNITSSVSEAETTVSKQEEELFKEQEAQKEIAAKQVLQLEHTLTVEEENYEFPHFNLLNSSKSNNNKNSRREMVDTAEKLQRTLDNFGVLARVVDATRGPAVTRYEIQPDDGVSVKKIANLADDIALNLAATSLRIEAPIPGKQAVGIEVPNKNNDTVCVRDVIQSDEFQDSESKLSIALGKNIAGELIIADIKKMPHVLIAGSTGSGKSVCINTLITSLIYKAKPSEVKLLMIDPKVVELSVYNGIPHLLIPVVTDPKKAAGALAWAVQEMVHRYNLFADKGVRDMKGYNDTLEKEGASGKLPQIVIIIDELADLMMVAKNDVEDAICRLAQMARAAGMHLVIATQRPSVDVITGVIKANIPSRISFAVSSGVDSRTILDMYGAEELLGKGDMLFFPTGIPKPIRIQGSFISDKEVEKVVAFVKKQGEATYNEDILEKIDNANSTDREMDTNDEDVDAFLDDAIKMVIDAGQASTSYIQRKFKVGYARAGRIIDQMEERGIISGYEGSKPRQVLISKEQFDEQFLSEASSEEILEESNDTDEETNPVST